MLSLAKAHFSKGVQLLHKGILPTGVWLCVRAYGHGEVNITLRGQTTQCPGAFASGTLQQCSSAGTEPSEGGRYDRCTADGQCVCRGEFARPTNSTYPGLGFEDCSARVVALPASRFVARHGQRAELANQVQTHLFLLCVCQNGRTLPGGSCEQCNFCRA